MAPAMVITSKLKKPTSLTIPRCGVEDVVETVKAAPIVPIGEIVPNFLYLGGMADACSEEALRRHDITHILSLTHKVSGVKACGRTHKNVPMNDSPEEDITTHFEECFAFMMEAQTHGGRLLVHCHMGISRAPTIVIAFLMKHGNLSLVEASSLVKAKRPIVSPRLSFLLALEAYGEMLEATGISDGTNALCACIEKLSFSHLDETSDGWPLPITLS